MVARVRLLSAGNRHGWRMAREWGDAVRELRLSAGLSRRALAESLGISATKLARWENAEPPLPDVVEASVVMRLLGQTLRWSWFPTGSPLRDEAHARLIAAFVALLHPDTWRRFEVPIALRGDLRAWDVLLRLGGHMVGVAAETRLRDWQALLRREEQKARDGGVDRLLLVLLNSVANREAVRAAGPSLREAFPLDGRTVLPALAAGRDPGANGLLFLSAAPRTSAPRSSRQLVVHRIKI